MNTNQRNTLLAVLAVLVAFGIGFGWQYADAHRLGGELAVASEALELQRLESTLGAATIEAQRGSYEIARQHASDFFTGLQSAAGTVREDLRPPLSDMLAQRDAMITALSRSDPQSGPLLAQLFVRFRLALGEEVGPQGAPPATPPRPEPAVNDSVRADSLPLGN